MDPREAAAEDQVRAATREQLARLEARIAAHPEGSAMGDGPGSGWIQALGDWWEAELRAQRVRVCRHLQINLGQPAHGCAWMPGLLACDLCVALGVFDLQGAADRICDRCGTDTLETGIHTGAATMGPISIEYGACPDCYQTIKATIEGASG